MQTSANHSQVRLHDKSRQAFERNIQIAFVCVAAAICLLIAFSIHTVNVQNANARLLGAVTEQLVLMDDQHRSLLQAESAARAYALTGLDTFKEDFGDTRVVALKLLDELERQDFDRPGRRQQVEQVVSLSRARIKLSEEPMLARETAGPDAARAVVASGRGKAVMDRIRELHVQITTAQRGAIAEISARNLRLSVQMQWLLVGFAILNLMLMGASLIVVRREWSRGSRIVRRLEVTTEEITLLNSLSSSLQSCSSVADAKESLQHFMERLFPGQSGAVYLMRASRNVLEEKAVWGDTGDWEVLMEPGECWALRLGQVHQYTPEGVNQPCKHVHDPQIECVCVPMMAEGEALGVLHLRNSGAASRVADQDDGGLRDRAERLAMQIGPAIANLSLRELLHQQSMRDGLTGLYNRRYLEETIGREVLRARRNQACMAVVMADVDHFKQYNDSHGHQAGDEVLIAFANFLQDGIRGEDIACRYGGEEFAIILPGVSPTGALERVERMRRGTTELSLRLRGEPMPPITASFGIAFFPQDGEEWVELLRAADGALYRAKHAGRNQVAVASVAAVD